MLKGKERKSIYIAPFCNKVHTKRSGMNRTVLPANNTMPAFPSLSYSRTFLSSYQYCAVSALCVQQMQRLPGLPSSNLMSDVLTGRLDSIGFEDILNGLFSHSTDD